MYCENCGKLIEDNAKFCRYCGMKVDEDVHIRMGYVQGNAGGQIGFSSGIIPEKAEDSGKKKPKWGVIAAAIVVIIVALAALIAFVIYNKPENRLERALDLGQKYLLEEDYEQAVVEFTKAIETDPNCSEGYMGRGQAYEGMGGSEENLDAALADYEMALEIDETITEAYIRMSDIYIMRGQHDKAEAILRKGLGKAERERRITEKLDDISYSESPDMAESEITGEDVEDTLEDTSGDSAEDTVEDIPENAVYIHSVAELKEALESGISDCTLVLDGIDYKMEFLSLYGLENVVIQGTEGTRILGSDDEDEVIGISECKGLTLKNLVIGHDIPVEWSCTSGVLGIYRSEVSLISCDLFGCGQIGFSANNSSIEAENTVIRDCSGYIMGCCDTTATFNRCTFSENGYKEPGNYAIEVYDFESESELSFSECVFDGNHNPELLSGISEEAVTLDRCSFSGNAWDE